MTKVRPAFAKYLSNAAWIAAFVALCGGYAFALLQASYRSPSVPAASQDHQPSNANDAWICPIAGKCGPPGTPGLGKW
jgi:hypothetical protein